MARAVIGLVAVLAVTTVTASPTQAAFPGNDGAIVFEYSGDIWRGQWSASGAWSQQRLTRTGAARNPTWSPDGRLIAYNTRGGQLRVMSATGTNDRVIVSAGAFQPAWSPRIDGVLHLLYVNVPPGTTRGTIRRVPLSGGTPTDVANSYCGASWPSWSPDGRRIAYIEAEPAPSSGCGADSPQTLVIVGAASGIRERTVKSAYSETASNDLFVRKARTDWTADSNHVIFDVEDFQCFDVWADYDVTTGRTPGTWENYHCESEPSRANWIPTPAGEELVDSLFEDSYCLWLVHNSVCNYSHPTFRGGGHYDVQPVPVTSYRPS